MKSKILCALLALCLFASLLPMTVLAADPDITVSFMNKGTKTDVEQAVPGVLINLTIKPGDAAKYVVVNAEGHMTEHTDAAAPADNYIKLEYPADGTATLKVTLKNVNIDSMCENDAYHRPAIEFGEGAYSISMELIGANKIIDGRSACIKNNNDGGLTITGTADSSLSLFMGSASSFGAAAATLWANGGDLVIKNTTLNFEIYTHTTSQHNSILSAKGNVLLEKVTVKNKANNGGQLVFTGLATADDPRHTIDPDASRTVTFKDCDIDSQTKGTMIRTTAPVILINTTVKAAGTAPLFSTAEKALNIPTLEGDYGAWGGKSSKPENAKQYALTENKLWKSSTYIKLLPGKYELPTEPDPTTKPTTPKETTPKETTPKATTPEATKADATTPEATKADATTPETTTPKATTPETTKSNATTPETTKSDATTPEATKADTGSEKESGNPLTVVLIVIVALVVAAGGALGVILYLQKKKAK